MMLNLNDKRGVILIVVYFLIVVLLIFSVIFINRTINDKNIALREKNIALAFHLAEAGLDSGLNWLKSEENPPIAQLILFGGPVALGGGNYTVTIAPNNPLSRYVITSIGNAGDVNRTLVNEVQASDFASFAWFTDRESFRYRGRWRALWFMTGDQMEGPVWTNSHYMMMGNPGFAGPVSSAGNVMAFFNNGSPIVRAPGVTSNPPNDVPVYDGGITLGVEPLELPTEAPDLIAAAVAGGFDLRGNTTVVLNADGTMNVTNSARGWDNENMNLPVSGALYVVDGANLTISGTLNGRLTVGAYSDIIIADNITYADNPRDNPNSDDLLGLIARTNVIIDGDAPSDIEIYGSIMALNGSFIVEGWDSGAAKGTLEVYGGIVQRYRGPVGTADLTGVKTSGYSRDYDYDPRLATVSPPFFPVTGDYISLSWRE